jgi:hypothetical protein
MEKRAAALWKSLTKKGLTPRTRGASAGFLRPSVLIIFENNYVRLIKSKPWDGSLGFY